MNKRVLQIGVELGVAVKGFVLYQVPQKWMRGCMSILHCWCMCIALVHLVLD